MSEIEFDELWQELIRVEYKDGGYENLRQVQRYIHGLSDQKRAAFLDELVSVGLNKKDGWGIALMALEGEAMPQHIKTICERVKFLPHHESEPESNLVWALRVLASDPAGQCLAPVEEYLLERKIGSYWNSLPWVLWPHHPDLFCRAWVRYFTSRPSKEWRHTVIPQAFLTRAEVLAQLKPKLSQASESAWQELRNVLWEQRNAPWLNEEQRKSLAEVISS
jgi:hypothetical protein